MKKSIILCLLFISSLFFASCSKDNDPADDNLFVGTYNGTISYSDVNTNTEISTDDGRVTLVKVGDTYTFDFSDGIPSLKGIKMDKNQSTLISEDGTVSIDEGTLIIAYSYDEEVWGANCTR
ncbi:hypothetical protein [Aurantibacter sp.]|uniref:hypothetical protein n=1 Tax=Aurantibacter sp. TaxID=2807103 RepID=UPI0032678DB0